MSPEESRQDEIIEKLTKENESLRQGLEKAEKENERLRKLLEEALRSLKRQAANPSLIRSGRDARKAWITARGHSAQFPIMWMKRFRFLCRRSVQTVAGR